MDAQELKKLADLESKMPRDWWACGDDGGRCVNILHGDQEGRLCSVHDDDLEGVDMPDVVQFIIDARQAVPFLLDALSAAQVENKRLRAALAAMHKSFGNYIDLYGFEHAGYMDSDGNHCDCPEDDTCDCEHVIAINKAFRLADAYFSRQPKDN